ncbi:MAG: hypothetical protein L3J21_03730 [Devosiaceae bacterium]|nr:hypothetical protein [Devosiaceae bacterium]
MISKIKSSAVLSGVTIAVLTVGFALSPLNIEFKNGQLGLTNNYAYANSDNSNSEMSSNGMGENAATDQNNMWDEIKNGIGALLGNQNFNYDRDNYDDDDDYKNSRSNSRPMTLDGFLDSLRNGATIVEVERSRNEIEIKYSDGWEEKIEYGRYELEAPNGRTIISRPATQKDLDRLNSAF